MPDVGATTGQHPHLLVPRPAHQESTTYTTSFCPVTQSQNLVWPHAVLFHCDPREPDRQTSTMTPLWFLINARHDASSDGGIRLPVRLPPTLTPCSRSRRLTASPLLWCSGFRRVLWPHQKFGGSHVLSCVQHRVHAVSKWAALPERRTRTSVVHASQPNPNS